ncbi:PfkB family carbohydrate kinase [Actinomycetospora aeridis]|uniref:PfkB family carbohydrate kinase n=1 Tax=Actinomycetospora aeridis TaxID=3129231 RepID=A0ABU8NDR5_9PSEU
MSPSMVVVGAVDGKAADAAVAAARIGVGVRLVGAVDHAGSSALDGLAGEGVVVDDVLVTDDGHLEAPYVRAVLNGAADLGAVLVSTAIPAAAVAAGVGTTSGLRVPCVLDPAPVVHTVVGLFDLAPVLTPDAAALTEILRLGGGAQAASPPSVAAGAATLHSWTGGPVIVPLGEEGVLVADDGRVRRLPAPDTAVCDTSGAADTLTGVLTAGLAAGQELDDALYVATVAAALCAAAPGGREAMPTGEALAAALE